MRPEALEAWTQLYAAVGLLAGICAVFALAKTAYDLRHGQIDLTQRDFLSKLLVIPKIWLHFQISYLTGFPCIMGIAVLFAHYVGFSEFIPS